jgi:hypothetical protein
LAGSLHFGILLNASLETRQVTRNVGGFYLENQLSEEPNSILEYIAALVNVDEQLVVTLKFCIRLLTEFKGQVPVPEGWQDMPDVFALTLHTAETAHEKKTMH